MWFPVSRHYLFLWCSFIGLSQNLLKSGIWLVGILNRWNIYTHTNSPQTILLPELFLYLSSLKAYYFLKFYFLQCVPSSIRLCLTTLCHCAQHFALLFTGNLLIKWGLDVSKQMQKANTVDEVRKKKWGSLSWSTKPQKLKNKFPIFWSIQTLGC